MERLAMAMWLLLLRAAPLRTPSSDGIGGGNGDVADAVLGEIDLLELACLWTDEVGTAAVWHHVLNLGISLAASAGSDVMNDYFRTMAIGATRVYVKPDGEFNTCTYLQALKQGQSFVSNWIIISA